MKMNRNRNLSSFILCTVLIVAMALSTTGCNGSTGKSESSQTTAGTDSGTKAETGNGSEAASSQSDSTVLGEGSISFPFTVVDQDGNETQFEIHTDQSVVGDALSELELIAGDESEYGLYVKTVNGITLDYDTDGKYWAFYVNGEYAATGVDSTPVVEGESYSFKAE